MPKWNINQYLGGSDGADLIGLQINKSDSSYQLLTPAGQQLASSTKRSLPISFSGFSYAGWIWTVTINSITNGASGGW